MRRRGNWERLDSLPEPTRRPTQRADCLPGGWNEARPCEFIACRYHLAELTESATGEFRVLRDWHERPTCALDVVDENQSGMRLEDIAEHMSMTRPRVYQLEDSALTKLRRGVRGALLRALHERKERQP